MPVRIAEIDACRKFAKRRKCTTTSASLDFLPSYVFTPFSAFVDLNEWPATTRTQDVALHLLLPLARRLRREPARGSSRLLCSSASRSAGRLDPLTAQSLTPAE
jgi:hypothetical protein